MLFFLSILFLNSIFLIKGDEGSKIVNGKIGKRGEFPYQVAMILKIKDTQDNFLCGASIIKKNALITAGHCLSNSVDALIIVGAHDLIANETKVQRFFANKTNFRIHPKFNYHYAILDVALIILTESIEFNEFAQPILLPSEQLLSESFAGEIGWVAGHGKFCDSCGSSSVLRYTKNQVMSNKECSKFFISGLIPSDSQLCLLTSETKSSACRGDSGK